ncbi:hypothetical protein JTS93_01540 [Clostridium botulinum]|nr:hypothetical protein [Clostridium botulinum]
MKRLNIYRIVFIISLLILPIIILFNMNLNNKINLVQEERNKLQLSFKIVTVLKV